MTARKEQIKKELQDVCVKHMDSWQVKGKNRHKRGDSNMSNTKVEDKKFGSCNGKSNSELNSSGRDADEVSSGEQPSEPKRQGYGSSLA